MVQARTNLAETTTVADFRGLTVFSTKYVVHCKYLRVNRKKDTNILNHTRGRVELEGLGDLLEFSKNFRK